MTQQDTGALSQPVTREAVVATADGLHARPAKALVDRASSFSSTVSLVLGEQKADAKSLLMVMTLGATQGTLIRIEAVGPDAEDAAASLVQLLSDPDL